MSPKPTRSHVRTAAAVVVAAAIVSAVALAAVAGLAPGGPGPSAVAVVPSPAPSATTAAAPSSAASLSASPSAAALPSASPSPSPSSSPDATPAPSVSPIPADQLQSTLDRLRAKASIPGVAVAILWDDGRRWVSASGMRDVATAAPMTTDTAFSLASISKTFTAAVVLQLVQEGKLGLDQPVAPLLPAFALDGRITVRMLLDHTSGLPDFFLGKGIDAALQADPGATWTPARAWTFVPPKHAVPGTSWAYSNTNYLLLGELVRKVTGHPIAVEVRRRLLDPLSLRSTWYQVAEAPLAPMTSAYRLVAKSGGGLRPVAITAASGVMPFRSVVTAAGGAGGLAATALDAARWMRAYAGGRVLNAVTQKAMLDDIAATVALKATIPYGLGIQQVMLAGRSALGHSGRYIGFRNVARYLPGAGLTIAVLTNQGVADPSAIAAGLLDVVLPQVPPPSTLISRVR